MQKMKQQHIIFSEEYIKHFNGAQAARDAGYSEKTARSIAAKLLARDDVKAYVSELKKQQREKNGIEVDTILKELIMWAYSDLTEFITLTPAEIKELPDDVRRLVQRFKYTKKPYYDADNDYIGEIETIELHFVSKEKAMEMLHKHIGFYEMDNEQRKTIIDLSQLTEDTLLKLWDARQ